MTEGLHPPRSGLRLRRRGNLCLRLRLRTLAVGPLWWAAAALVALAVLLPAASLLALAAQAGVGHWAHLLAHVLPTAAANTALLLLGVGLAVAVVGTGCAWLVARYDFPLRPVLQWALLLPLAVPTYIVAYAYVDLLHPIGPVQSLVRALLGFESPRQFRLPDLRSTGGAIFVLAAVLYPYVYLSMRAMFATQPQRLLDVARTLGCSPAQAFWRVALPLARPALAVGLSLALLEVLNDIGASEFMGVTTLTVSIYTTWVTRSELGAAAQIAVAMLLIVLALVWLERQGRRHQRHGLVQQMQPMQPQRLRGAAAWGATAAASLPVLLGFVLPAAHLGWLAWRRAAEGHGMTPELLAASANTAALALGVTALALAAGLVVAWAARPAAGGWATQSWLARCACMGYAIPGTILAIGVLAPAIWLDGWLAQALNLRGLPLMGLGGVLAAACVLRFLAMPVGSLEAGLMRLPPHLEQASRSLGHGPAATLWRVHLPLLRPALLTSGLMVFIDVMKELPATLLLRPANFETLSTLLYAEASRGSYEHGALAALLIVIVGLPAVLLLSRTQRAAAQAPGAANPAASPAATPVATQPASPAAAQAPATPATLATLAAPAAPGPAAGSAQARPQAPLPPP